MDVSTACFPREASLNELLHDPIIGLVMASDGVRSEDIRALYNKLERRNEAKRQRARDLGAMERCFIR
ncbi:MULTISPECIES: hypothetical protein [Kaistia]|uniref:Uncharacterized protein n=1 Tax=Kaistia nematophila TaxID=2994654 RepID=A0A9X3IMD8_9HYPH|nr:hypothetical protein [Kaistia nematophila]MCX5571684.1 hypothetical protein [Kaistia nematophila]